MPPGREQMACPVSLHLLLSQDVGILCIVKKHRLPALNLRQEVSLAIQVVGSDSVGRSDEDGQDVIMIPAAQIDSG